MVLRLANVFGEPKIESSMIRTLGTLSSSFLSRSARLVSHAKAPSQLISLLMLLP